MREYNITIVY